jgi:lysophospholipase L1-like esterase
MKKAQKRNVEKIILVILSIFVLVLLVYEFYKIGQLNESLAALQTQIDSNYEETNEKLDTYKDEIDIYLPDVIYVAEDITTELYDSQVTSLGEKIDNYNVTWVCDIGKNMERKFTITGTLDLIGEYPLVFNVFDNKMNLIASKSTILSVVDNEIPIPISILTIGDSLSSDANGYLHLAELGQGNIEFVGTRDIDGYKCEARIGFSASDYLSETHFQYETGEPLQPFFNKETNQFDWNYYKKNTGCDPDVIEIFLGTNGIDVDATENGNSIMQMIDLIREADSDIPIYVVNTIYTSNQDGIGSWQNSHSSPVLPGRYKFEEDTKVFNLMVYLKEKLTDYHKVYLVPAAITFDSANNFNTSTEVQSPYATSTIEVPDNGIHPGTAGYKQIADTVFSTLCGTIREW